MHVPAVLQVRQAYQHKGWVLNNLSGIEQCKDDGYLKSVEEQKGEGCHVWGQLTVSIGFWWRVPGLRLVDAEAQSAEAGRAV